MTCTARGRVLRNDEEPVVRRCSRWRWHLGRHNYKGARW